MISNTKGFTLIEILLGVVIFSISVIAGFQALSAVNIGKIKLVEQTYVLKEANYFTEKLFEEIKVGGTIDYEEYFNRRVYSTEVSTGHYEKNTGFGNFGSGGTVETTNYGDNLYFCRSVTGNNMGTGGCFNTPLNIYGNPVNGKTQRYGQYKYQFIDYNSNDNNESGKCGTSHGGPGDEDCDKNIRGDDDDENLGIGPVVFTGGTNVKEIYLISGDKKVRTYFRWNWRLDPSKNKPTGANAVKCDSSVVFGTGCIGTIEFLKLHGKDRGVNHDKTGSGYADGIIDTWIVDPNFTGGVDVIAGSGNLTTLGGWDGGYRQSLFPENLSISNFEVFLYPNIDRVYAWKDTTEQTDINPYLRLKMTINPSRKKRAGIKGKIPSVNIVTTINLTDYFSQ